MISRFHPKTTYIYGIENLVTHRWYIGQSINPRDRFHQHMFSPQSEKMRNDRNDYGKESFRLHVLAEVPVFLANEAEQKWYDSCSIWNSMYNLERPNNRTRLFDKQCYEYPESYPVERVLGVYDKCFP